MRTSILALKGKLNGKILLLRFFLSGILNSTQIFCVFLESSLTLPASSLRCIVINKVMFCS